MIVVSNTSPINNLAKIGQLDLTRQLYDAIIIPNGVYRELTLPEFPVAGANEVQIFDWISVTEVSDRSTVDALQTELDIGEAEAIAILLLVLRSKLMLRLVERSLPILILKKLPICPILDWSLINGNKINP